MLLENTIDIFTKRLVLRRFTLNDAVPMFEILRDKDTNVFLPWLAHENISQTKEFLQKRFIDKYSEPTGYRYAICLKDSSLPIGYACLSGDESNDFGYCVAKKYWHKGIGFEATKAVVARIENAGYEFITATHDINNPNSGEIMKKRGMKYKYSYVEQWQPKDIAVTFRMYQLNFNNENTHTYAEYWNKYESHFIEENI